MTLLTVKIHQDRLEICIICGNPTDKAGASDDSIYCEFESCGEGPFCDPCYIKHKVRFHSNGNNELIY